MINEENLSSKLMGCGIPVRMNAGIRRYLFSRIEPGGFLRAVLENDLCEAFARADPENADALMNYARFMFNELPMRGPGSPWGSKAAVREWLEGGDNDSNS